MPFIRNLKATFGISVKIIRCDNAGENQSFEVTSKQEGLGLIFEYTAPNTPQQNGRVERKFQTLFGRVRAMLAGFGIENPLRNRFRSKSANTATHLDNFLARDSSSGLNSFEQFFGKGVIRNNISSTRKFGESCVATNRDKIKAKFADRGKEGIWVGYTTALSQARDTHRIYKYLDE